MLRIFRYNSRNNKKFVKKLQWKMLLRTCWMHFWQPCWKTLLQLCEKLIDFSSFLFQNFSQKKSSEQVQCSLDNPARTILFFFLSNSWENFVFPKFSRKTFHDTFNAVLTSLSTHFRSNSVKQIDSLFSIFLGQKNLPRAKKRCATSPKEVFNFHNIFPNFFPETVPLDT